MNIFVLSTDPVQAAMMMCDKHIPKMVVESAQMLSTAHRIADGSMELQPSKSGKRMIKQFVLPDYRENIFYKSVHMHHPCTVWTGASNFNYVWHWKHFQALCKEYTYRYNKVHMTETKLLSHLRIPPDNIPTGPQTDFALAMKQYPECIVPTDAVQSYRNYYNAAKTGFAKWAKGRNAPEWWKG